MATLGKTRALGQHFLKDKKIAQKIAETAVQEMQKHQCESLLEIGPGKGAITYPLLEIMSNSMGRQKLLLVERDPQLADFWNRQSSLSGFRLENQDFLDLEDSKWLGSSSLAVVSNLPYSSATAILKRLALNSKKVSVMVLMFQAEVARRLRAEPGEKARGSLSVWIQNQWDVKKLIFVPPQAFIPPPQVDSEVVILTRREELRVQHSHDLEGLSWGSLLKVCFSQRRKMLRKVVKTSDLWRNALERSGVNATKRAEALEWEEWNRLFQAARQLSNLP